MAISMYLRNALAEKIAGEITLSPKPGQTIRKWRDIFKISQTELSASLNISPSVISDYESGRRKSPGIQIIKHIVDGLLEIDMTQNDGLIIEQYRSFDRRKPDGIIDICEYPFTISAKKFIDSIEGKVLTSKQSLAAAKDINGFTLVDSIKTITMLNSSNYVQLYGWSTDRALVFTGVRYGRSPMIAIRIHPVKPAMIVYHKVDEVDPLAVKLAEREKMPLVITNMPLQQLQIVLNQLRTGETIDD